MLHDILSVEFSDGAKKRAQCTLQEKTATARGRRGSGWLLATPADVGSKSTFVMVIFLSRQSTFEKDMSKEVRLLTIRLGQKYRVTLSANQNKAGSSE